MTAPAPLPTATTAPLAAGLPAPALVLPRCVVAAQFDQAGRHSFQQRLRWVACPAASAHKLARHLLAARRDADDCLHGLANDHIPQAGQR